MLSSEDRNEIDLEAETYLLSAALWGPLICVERVGAVCPSGTLGRRHWSNSVSFAATLHPILDTEVNAWNEQALGFYRRLSFVEIAYSPLDDQGRAYPSIRMRLLAEAIR
jgi:hypothetical protein